MSSPEKIGSKPRGRSYLFYFFLPVLTCAYLAMKQYNMFDTNLITFAKQKNASPTSLRGQTNHENPQNDDDDEPVVDQKKEGDDKEETATSNESEVKKNVVDDKQTTENAKEAKSKNAEDGDAEKKVQSEEIENHTNSSIAKEMPKFETGSFGNCTRSDNGEVKFAEITSDDGGILQVTCKAIPFRAQIKSIHSPKKIITGVLSGASGDGPARRDLIRRTWASGRDGIFFLVAGPWADIESEYNEKGDLIWIDEEEVYNGEQSVLTLKTYSFLAIVYAAMQKNQQSGDDTGKYEYSHVFKTDDDSYFNIDALRTEVDTPDPSIQEQYKGWPMSDFVGRDHDFVGQCQLKFKEVHREDDYKWPLREETYPESFYPRYCQGAGFGISKKFLQCAVSQGHIANVRFMPFEDVAVGMLSERCGVSPQWPSTAAVKVFRYKSDEAKKRTQTGDKRNDDLVAPGACMSGKIVQHRIIDDEDMEDHHKTVLDPTYCEVTKEKRAARIKELEEKNITWYD